MATKYVDKLQIRLPKEYTPWYLDQLIQNKYNGIETEVDPNMPPPWCYVNAMRNRQGIPKYEIQRVSKEPIGQRVIMVPAGDEEMGNWSNEQKKKDLNDEAEVASHTSGLLLEQRQE